MKRGILTALVIALLVSAGGAAFALWRTEKKNAQNTLAVGGVEMSLDKESGDSAYFSATLAPRGDFAPADYEEAKQLAREDNGETIADAIIAVSRTAEFRAGYKISLSDAAYANNAQTRAAIRLTCYRLDGMEGVATDWTGTPFSAAPPLRGLLGAGEVKYHLFLTAESGFASGRNFSFDVVLESMLNVNFTSAEWFSAWQIADEDTSPFVLTSSGDSLNINIKTAQSSNQLEARRFVFYLDAREWSQYAPADVVAVGFKYSGSENYVNAAESRMRIFAKQNPGLDSVQITDGSGGISLIKDVPVGTREKQFTMKLADWNALTTVRFTANYIGFVACGEANSSLRIEDFTFLNATEYEAARRAELAAENFTSTDSGWRVIAPTVSQLVLNGEEIQLTKKLTGSSLTGRDHAIVLDAKTFAEASELGFSTLTFSYRGDSIFAASAFPKIRMYGKQDGGRDLSHVQEGTAGLSLFSPSLDLTVTSEWQTATILLSDFLALENHNYLGIVVGGDAQSVLTLRDMKFSV